MPHIRVNSILIAIALLAAVLLPRITDLNKFVTADEPRWQSNVAAFTTKLACGQMGDLLQQPHPGITMQWFAAPGIWQSSWEGRKMPLILAQCILLLLAGYFMFRLWGKRAGIFGILFLAINPFLIAHTRVYAMDSLLAIFLLISLLSLLIWHKRYERQYLVYAGMAGAFAFLSKLPGISVLPFSIFLIILFVWDRGWKKAAAAAGIWIVSFLVTAVIVLPSFLVRPIGVLQDMASFFSSGDYTSLHQYGPYYYFGTLLFLTTLVQVTALFIAIVKPSIIRSKKEIAVLLGFAVCFFVMMTIGAKKGDRYILPVFLMFDACAAYVVARIFRQPYTWLAILSICAIIFQAGDLIHLHPYELAYVNPLTKPWIGDRQLGWGEGLDIAAAYLNTKPDAKALQVATYYNTQSSSLFQSKTVPLHTWDSGSNDYAILYRAMYGRGPDAWETDVLHNFRNSTPEKTISLDGIPYIWIYKLK